jgi:acylphosphatase
MIRVGEKVVVLKPFSNSFGMTGWVRMIEDGYVYVDYDEKSIADLKKQAKKTNIASFATLTGEAFSPRHVMSLISFIRDQKLKILGI